MKIRFYSLVVLYFSFSALTATYAQQKQALSQQLSLEQAVKLGLESSKVLHSSQMKVNAADAKVQESGASMLPSLSVSGNYTRLSDIDPQRINLFAGVDFAALPKASQDAFLPLLAQLNKPAESGSSGGVGFPVILDNFSLKASVAYPVFTGFRLEAAKSAAEYNAQAANQDLTKDKIETAFNVKNAYWTLYKAFQLKKVAEESVTQVEARLKDAQNMLKNGMMTTNDVLRLQVQLSNTQLSRIDANNAVRLSMVSLNNLLGLPLATELNLTTSVEYQATTTPEFEQSLQKALASRPELAATELRIKAAEENVRATKGSALPQVNVGVNYEMANPNQRYTLAGAVWKGTWNLGVQLSWTVWNWGVTGYQAAQAEAQVAQVQDNLEQLKDGIKVEVMQNYLSLLQAKEKISVAKQGVEQSEENYRVTNEKFKKGSALTTDVVDAETARLQAKVSYVNSVVDHEVAQAKLIKSIGEQTVAAGK